MNGTIQQGNRNPKDQKGRSTPRDRRHLQTASFETPICKNFFARKFSNFVPKCSVHPTFSIHFNILEKRILLMIWSLNSNDRALHEVTVTTFSEFRRSRQHRFLKLNKSRRVLWFNKQLRRGILRAKL